VNDFFGWHLRPLFDRNRPKGRALYRGSHVTTQER
jgi:hypothetical protein